MSTVSVPTTIAASARDLFVLYSKKGAFTIEEYSDCGSVFKRIVTAVEGAQKESNVDLSETDVKYVVSAINVCSQRVPTEVANYKPIAELLEALSAALSDAVADTEESKSSDALHNNAKFDHFQSCTTKGNKYRVHTLSVQAKLSCAVQDDCPYCYKGVRKMDASDRHDSSCVPPDLFKAIEQLDKRLASQRPTVSLDDTLKKVSSLEMELLTTKNELLKLKYDVLLEVTQKK